MKEVLVEKKGTKSITTILLGLVFALISGCVMALTIFYYINSGKGFFMTLKLSAICLIASVFIIAGLLMIGGSIRNMIYDLKNQKPILYIQNGCLFYDDLKKVHSIDKKDVKKVIAEMEVIHKRGKKEYADNGALEIKLENNKKIANHIKLNDIKSPKNVADKIKSFMAV